MASRAAFAAFVNTIRVNVQHQTETTARRMLVQTAIRERDRVIREQTGRAGVRPTYKQIVDSREGAPLPSVKPDGFILFEWNYVREIAQQAIALLRDKGPEDQGDWKKSVVCFADDAEIDPEAIPEKARIIEVAPTMVYSRFLEEVENFSELGFDLVSSTAMHLAAEWREYAKVRFAYIALAGEYEAAAAAKRRGEKVQAMRYPTIRIEPL